MGMNPNFSRPKAIAIAAGVVLLIAAAIAGLFIWSPLAGWIGVGVIVVVLAILAIVYLPPVFRWMRFQKTFKKFEGQLQQLPTLMMAGRTQQALLLFEEAMKEAPENAYTYYLRARFNERAGKLPEALAAANKALSLAGSDPFLPVILQQVGGQAGQPATVAEFRRQTEEMRGALEPRVNMVRQQKERAKKDRKKKSR